MSEEIKGKKIRKIYHLDYVLINSINIERSIKLDLMYDNILDSEIYISLGFKLTIVDTPNVLYCHAGEVKQREEAIIKMIKNKKNRFFYLITTSKMRTESNSFIQKMVELKKDLKNYEFIFVEKNNDPDVEILKISSLLKCPVISNDKFTQKKYDDFRNKGIEVWRFTFRQKDFCLKIKEIWKL